MQREEFIKLNCPECHGELIDKDKVYSCQSCNLLFPIIDSIPSFSEDNRYYGEIDNHEMKALINLAKEKGYHVALKQYLLDPWVYSYTIDESRAKLQMVLPLHSDSALLDIGCGWGTIAIPLARRVKYVVALDSTYERVKFVQIRGEQSGLKNIVPIKGTAIKLPLPSNVIDIVIFNGVLEWLGYIDRNKSPQKIQVEALAEAYRVLKPGGCVYVGIENRYSLRYILGEPDDHSFIKFTSLMPRWMADWWCLRMKGEKYYTHTHSFKKYKKMLSLSGFNEIATYLPLPSYKQINEILPLEKKPILESLKAQIQKSKFGRKWVFNALLLILTYLGLHRFFVHSFCFVARK